MFEKAPPEENMPDIKFVEWLQSSNPNDSLYWISGKAGSGKSTLMKYILAHQETSASLKAWAAGHNLVIASFFFWHSGTDMQKSQTGLFQSLLFEILRASPDVIQDLLPIRWTETTQEPWTKTELRQVLSSLSEKLRSSARFCFLIDGIDEYCGEACDIMDAVQDLSKPENVKVCCSSRPWSVFKEGLDKDTKRRLYLQDLTRADIQRYVSTKLEANANFVTANYEDERHQQIINYVVENSQGVFLWVSLVVRSLLRGLSNADTLDVLYDRLTRLPTDLNEFFDYMLRGIEVHYKRQSMYTFKVALKSRKTLLLVQYYALDDLQSNPNLALTLQTAPSTEGAKSKSIFEIGRNEIKMEKRLEARSKGLLEVVCESNDGRIAKRVGFLHRTVREFLTQPHIRQRIMDVTGDSFTGGLAMASSILSVIKLTPLGLRDRLENNLLSEMFDDFFVCFHQLSPEQHQTAIRTIDELQQVLETRYHSRFGQVDFRQLKMHDYRALDKRFLAKSQPRSVLEACALYHIDFYLEYRLRKDPSLSQAQFHRPLLSHVLLPWHLASGILLPGFPETSTVDILLRSGCDPNGKVDEGPDTVWTRFLSGWFRTQEEQSRSHNIGTSNRIRIHVTGYGKNLIRPLRSLIKRLLVSGADVNAINPRNTSSTFWGEIVNNMEEHDAVGADMRMHLLKLWLQHGADPNAEYREGYTVWKKRLVDLYQDRISGAPAFNCVDEVELFLQYGADPDVMLRLNNHNRRLEDVLDFLFPTLDIDQARHLAEVVREQRAKRSAPRFENETE